MDLRDNNLRMQMPSWIGNLLNISTLALRKNSFSGVIPRSLQNMSKLETLMLESNMLSGETPSWLFEMESLKNMYIGGNNMIWKNSVKINPKCMLSQMSLRSCKIEGDIPG